MTVNFHHKEKETIYHIDINGVDHVMTRSFGLDNEGVPLDGVWAVYNMDSGELIVAHQERRVIRKYLNDRDLVQQSPKNIPGSVDVKLSTLSPEDVQGIPFMDDMNEGDQS